MQEIEAKKQLKASEGAHFFYTLIFLSASGIIETQFIEQKCNQNLQLFVHLVFYGLIIWGTYILITLIPRYKNAAINLFFNFLDICFGIYIILLLIYGGRMYQSPSDCQTEAPALFFFLETFLLVFCFRKFIRLTVSFLQFCSWHSFRMFLRDFRNLNKCMMIIKKNFTMLDIIFIIQMNNTIQSIRRPVTSQNYRSSDKLEKQNNEKLPNLSEVMSLKLKQQSEKDLQELIINLVKKVQQQNSALALKEKQILQYEFMIKSLQIAIDKRDCIISALRVEKQQIVEVVNPLKNVVKSDESSRQQSFRGKKSLRTRTKDTNFDENLSAILDSDYALLSQYVKCYEELSHLSQIKTLVSNEEQFLANIQKMELSNIVNIFDAIQLVLHEHKLLFKNVIKQNKLFQACLEMHEQIPLNDQLENLQDLLKDCLNCDRVQVYVLDNEQQELWAKLKDRVSMFQEKGIINVHNAYNDPRFKKDNEKGYKTNTILLCPILDKQQNSIGVIMAVNKINGHFNNDDQLYITKTSESTSILLRNHQQSNESISIQNALRNVIYVLIILCQAQLQLIYMNDLEAILFESENLLKNLFHTQKGLIYVVNNNRLLRVNEKKLLEISQLGVGIIGEAHITKEFLCIQNAYNHQSFNSLSLQIDD
ncbi:unnamed protein product (macronuclear) [Paramecium tetraurelia]|uniref:GAF domain-containing protein n=1 Tax=Paramecium tetraurelia TaxID=5888 RepID=A0E4G9_PARTE|nr:uncharacterized protein GSPATT00023361001 [Paramecium tetraurelia]CAK90186.1 unnamed protein product [Paramecium tetraurelia]|eukprot:XP_001457583.1 hypothetical protein (macronuclear) [Paramecium tetraurelia strain d4-2]